MSKATLVVAVGLRRETCAFNHLLASVDTGGNTEGPRLQAHLTQPRLDGKSRQPRTQNGYLLFYSLHCSFFFF